MNIVLIGTVDFSLRMLERLIAMKAGVVGVVTKRRSPQNSDFADLSGACRKAGIPVHYAEDINAAAVGRWIADLKPDIIFCFGLSQILSPEILSIAPYGVLGYHPAALPQNRGRHPIIWALALDLKKTASTFFLMDQGADSGDIVSQKIVRIRPVETASSLYAKLAQTAAGQLRTIMRQLKTGQLTRRKQNERRASSWRKRSKEDGQVDFRMTARAVDCLVRALSKPYPGAHVVYRGQEIKIWAAKPAKVRAPHAEPGKVLGLRGRAVLVKCFDQAVWLTEHEFEHLPREGEYIR